MKILIADDDDAVRELLGEMVVTLGHEPVLAPHGQQAWEMFDREPVRILVTDWIMPHMDGIELARRVRAAKRTRYTYIIVLTALGGSENYLAGMNAGADDFVTKPVSSNELHARLRVAERILALQDDVNLLEGLLSICMYCKDVHVAENDWTSVERYVEERSDASFSHGICPRCYESRVLPDLERFGSELGCDDQERSP